MQNRLLKVMGRQPVESHCKVTKPEIRLLVVDPEAASSLASIPITVSSHSCSHRGHSLSRSGGRLLFRYSITFSAQITDTEDPAELPSFSWKAPSTENSGLTDALDSEGMTSSETRLSEGNHTITLTATDLTGKSTRKTSSPLTSMVPIVNPACAISPVLTAFKAGDNIDFEANAADDDLEYTALYTQWTSSVDGDLGLGTIDDQGVAALDISTLSVNTHTITTVQDDWQFLL